MKPLYEQFKEQCVFIDKTRVPDGEGGFVYKWVEGLPFMATVTKDTTLQARIAEKDGLKNIYTVTAGVNTGLDFHDVFKRVRDGQVFRVTSNADDKRTPSVASFQFEVANAEEWELP